MGFRYSLLTNLSRIGIPVVGHVLPDMGTAEVGKNADLVLLDANHIESVQNLHKIDAVIRAASYHSKEELNSIKEKYTNEK